MDSQHETLKAVEKLLAATIVAPILCAVSPEAAARVMTGEGDPHELHTLARRWVDRSIPDLIPHLIPAEENWEQVLQTMFSLLFAYKGMGTTKTIGGVEVPVLS